MGDSYICVYISEENWSAWGEWTKCNSPCGPGVSRRVRNCLDINDIGCPGRRSEKKECVHPTIPNCSSMCCILFYFIIFFIKTIFTHADLFPAQADFK